MKRKRRGFPLAVKGLLLGIAALGTSATAFLYYQHAHLPPPPPPPPSPPPAAPPPHGMRSVDPTRVELFCGKEFCAYTWQGRPGVIAVTTAGGEETEKNLFHTYVDTRAATSPLLYLKPMVERICRSYPHGNGLLLGLGGGAFPLLLRAKCPDGPSLVAVDPSADTLFIARTFVQADDGRMTRYEVAKGEDFIATVADTSLDFVLNDAYAGIEPVPVLMEQPFLRRVHAALRPGGLYAANVLGEQHNDRAAEGIRGAFGSEAERLRIEGTMNTWVMGVKEGGPGGGGAPPAGASSSPPPGAQGAAGGRRRHHQAARRQR